MLLPVVAGAVICAGAGAASRETDVSGVWDMRVEAAGEASDVVLSLRQDGEKLTGSYRGGMGETNLEGTVRDQTVRFTVSFTIREITFTVSYSGVAEADQMSGTAEFGEDRTGKWVARRRQESRAGGPAPVRTRECGPRPRAG